MCRLVTFAGSCTRCGEAQLWDDLNQQLWCLEAKNGGIFGDCSKGIFPEQHSFDQECDRCTDEDEGLGDVGDDGPQAAKEMTHVAAETNRDDEAQNRDRKRAKT